MKETHPFLDLGKIPNATKLVIGSFPVYFIKQPDSGKRIKLEKVRNI
jgi:hypothetical protein